MTLAARIAGYRCPECGAELPFLDLNKTGRRSGRDKPITCPGCGARLRIGDHGAPGLVKFLLIQAPVALLPPIALAEVLRFWPVTGVPDAAGGATLSPLGLGLVLALFVFCGLVSRRFARIEAVGAGDAAAAKGKDKP